MGTRTWGHRGAASPSSMVFPKAFPNLSAIMHDTPNAVPNPWGPHHPLWTHQRTRGQGHGDKDTGTKKWGQGHGDTLVPPLQSQWGSSNPMPSCMTHPQRCPQPMGSTHRPWGRTKGHGDKAMGTRPWGQGHGDSHGGAPELTWCHRGAGGLWGGSSAACTPPPAPRRTPGRWWPKPRWPR